MTHVSRRHAAVATEQEPWYGTAYSAAPLRAELLDGWAAASPHAALQLPPPNPFIPTDFTLAADLETATRATAAADDANAGPAASRAAQDALAPPSASAAAAARAAVAAWEAPLRKLRGLGGENVRHTDAGSSGALDMDMAYACICTCTCMHIIPCTPYHAHAVHTPCTRRAHAAHTLHVQAHWTPSSS